MSREKDNLTIVEIAEQLDLSVATVSRALHNHKSVKEETRKRVKNLADKLGYKINAVASSLRSNKSNIIGLIVPKISMYFQSQVITSIQNELSDCGYNLIILQSNDSPDLEKKAIETLISLRVAGVIVAVTLRTTDFSPFEIFLKRNIPVVFYDRIPNYDFGSINIAGDDKQGGFEGTRHLIEVGCKNILFITGPLQSNIYKNRTAGYKLALKRAGIPFKKENIYSHELTWENAWSSINEAFEKDKTIDGIFTTNDTSAIAALEFCKTNGLSVPKKVKILGYSNDERTSITSPSISSIEQFPNEFGVKAVQQLMLHVNLPENTSQQKLQKKILIPVKLVRRMST